MNSLIAVIITTSFFLISGWYITYFFPINNKIERLGLSFLIGSGLSTFLWFLGYLIGLPFNLYALAFIGGIEISVGYYLSYKLRLIRVEHIKIPNNKIYLLLITLIVTILLISFLIGSHNALTAWDSIALYDFRGHTIAVNHSLKDLTDSSYYVSYPLMISLVHAVVYMLGGISAQGIHSVFLMAFTAVIYGRMRDWTSQLMALFTCLLVITQNEIFYHSTFAYTNLPYLTFLVSGILYAVSAKMDKSNFLPLAGLMIGLSTWVRSTETFWIIGIILILWQGLNTKHKLLAIFSAIMVIVMRMTWITYFNHILVSINYSYDETIRSFSIKNIQRIISNWLEIYWYMRLNIFLPYSGIWFLLVPISFTWIVKRNTKLLLLLGSIVLTASMLIVGIAVFSTFYTTWNEIGDSARRMILFINPLSLITTMYSVHVATQKDNHE